MTWHHSHQQQRFDSSRTKVIHGIGGTHWESNICELSTYQLIEVAQDHRAVAVFGDALQVCKILRPADAGVIHLHCSGAGGGLLCTLHRCCARYWPRHHGSLHCGEHSLIFALCLNPHNHSPAHYLFRFKLHKANRHVLVSLDTLT